MSFILDALNKAQREREEQQEPVPQLSTVHYTPPAPTPSPRTGLNRKALVAGAAGLSVVIFAGIMWLAPAEKGVVAEGGMQTADIVSVAPAPQSQVQAQPPVQNPQPVQPVRVDPAPTAARTPREQDEVVGLYQSSRAGMKTQGARQAPPDAARAATAPSTQMAIDRQRPAPAPVRPSARPTEAVPVAVKPTVVEPVPVTVQPAGQQNSIAARADLPYLQQLSWAMQQKLPTIMYAEHHYDPDPAKRSVVINGNTHRAGAQIGQGLKLEEILSDGAVMRYESRTFKLEALNSWVNF